MAALAIVGMVGAGPAPDAGAERYCNPQPRAVQDRVERLAGPDRYSTAVAISKATFAPGVCTVYIASGANFPDALSGAARAAAYTAAPVLLVQPTGIPTMVAEELRRLDPYDIVVLGGPSAVSAGVAAQLESFAEGIVMRLSGSDRYATAVDVFWTTPQPVAKVYIASGETFPDALAGAPLAGRGNAPLLLTARYGIPTFVKDFLRMLKPQQIVILGSAGAVSSQVESELRSYTTGSVTRLQGPDRYATAVAISKAMAPAGSYTVYIASGANYPDALAVAPTASLSGAPVLLVAPDSIPDVVAAELARLRPRHIVILGSPGAVSSGVELELQQYLVP
ncbi:cell wall-binding repeat-containing protein [Agromyces arachidis]|uniref:cell wall-binding repeat-containing protein n=1 Tax=Agromyces arachidis TaxID=766966 RepID=UPI0040569DBA